MQYTLSRLRYAQGTYNARTKRNNNTSVVSEGVKNVVSEVVMVKILVSEGDFRVLQSTGCTNLATQLILKTPVLGLSPVKISAESFLYLALHFDQNNNKKEKKMKTNMSPHMNPKTPPGVSKF